MILSCNNIEKSFDGNTILSKCSFIANEHEKIAVVGINGAGKSTLLKIIMKELPADSGDVIIAKDTSIGYLAQHQDVYSENSIYEELLTVKKEIIDKMSMCLPLSVIEQKKYYSNTKVNYSLFKSF